MFNISQFFEKFAKLGRKNNLLKQAFVATVKNISHIDLTPEECEFKEGKVYLNCSPLRRNELFMFKDAIEKSLREQKIFLRIY